MKNNNSNITHFNKNLTLEKSIENIKSRIISRGDLSYISINKQLEILKELASFPLGCFMIEHQGLNGFWTDYVISSAINENLLDQTKNYSKLEDYIINHCPLTLATRERFKIFQKEISNNLKNEINICSIPCGCMRDILSLDYSRLKKFNLIGVDIDEESLKYADNLAKKNQLKNHVTFYQLDAWNLPFDNEIDIITSNGLNVYESDNKKVINLYKKFNTALKKEGFLIIGVLTYPPGFDKDSDWILDKIDPNDLMFQKILYEDILESKWQNFRTSKEIFDDFKKAGFNKINIEYDSYHIFPTIIARK